MHTALDVGGRGVLHYPISPHHLPDKHIPSQIPRLITLGVPRKSPCLWSFFVEFLGSA